MLNIYHGKKEAYYKSLVKLPAAKLVRLKLTDSPDMDQETVAEILGLLKDIREEEEAAGAIADIDEAAVEDDDQDIYEAIAAAPDRPPPEVVTRNVLVPIGSRDVRIYYDNCSHQSGKQRAWAVCPDRTHARCFRYRFIESFASPTACEQFLTAWAYSAVLRPCSRKEHQDRIPSDAEVADILAQIP